MADGIEVTPSEAFYCYTSPIDTGLVGAIGVRILQGSTVIQARSTSGIAEFPAGSGIYSAYRTAPAAEGDYLIVWDNGSGQYADESLFVDTTISGGGGTGGGGTGGGDIAVAGVGVPAGPVLQILQGDDYNDADGRPLVFTSTNWPSLAAASDVQMVIGGPTPGILTAVSGDVLAVTGDSQRIAFELTAGETGGLETGHGRYDARATISSRSVSLVRGFVRVYPRP